MPSNYGKRNIRSYEREEIVSLLFGLLSMIAGFFIIYFILKGKTKPGFAEFILSIIAAAQIACGFLVVVLNLIKG